MREQSAGLSLLSQKLRSVRTGFIEDSEHPSAGAGQEITDPVYLTFLGFLGLDDQERPLHLTGQTQ